MDIVQEFVTSQLQAPDDAPPPPGGWLSEQLQRLQRLLALRDAHASNLNSEGRRLLDHAIFTTFVDCRDLGGEARASALLTPPLLTPSEVNATAALPASDGDGPGTDAPAAPGATESSPRGLRPARPGPARLARHWPGGSGRNRDDGRIQAGAALRTA